MSTQRIDRAALAWGTVFTVIGVAFLLQEAGLWRVRAEVFLPVLLIIAGAVLALGGVLREEPRRD